MKITREVKTGLLAVVAIALFIYGYSFLKGNNILNSDRTFYAVYDNVQGLSASAPVTINGLQVGSISDISFVNSQGDLLVTMQVSSDFEFSENSIAQISSNGLLGGKHMVIDIKNAGPPAESGDTLTGKVEVGLLQSMGGQLEPLQKKVESAIVSADSLISGFNQVLTPNARKDLKSTFDNLAKTMASLKGAAASLEKLLAKNDEKLNRTFTNLDEMSANLNKFSEGLAKVDINQLTTDLQAVIDNFKAISAGLKNGEGTLGKMLTDEGVYNNLESATKQLEELLQDIKLNPDRYVHISVFGGKADEYEEPEDSPK